MGIFRRLVVFLCQLVFLLFIATEYIDLWFIRFLGQNVFQGNHSTKIIAVISILLFWLMTWVCIKGVSWISKVTSLAGGARLFMGVAFVVLAFVVVFGFGNEPAQEFTTTSIMPTLIGLFHDDGVDFTSCWRW